MAREGARLSLRSCPPTGRSGEAPAGSGGRFGSTIVIGGLEAMKVRRLMSEDDLGDLPLDAFDRFLLRRIGGATKDVDELPVPAPYERSDITLRIDYLLRLGALEAIDRSLHETRDTPV